MITALVPAAGRGVRFGSPGPKALVPIGGRPMLLWSIDAISAIPTVSEIMVAAPEGMVDDFESLRRATEMRDGPNRPRMAWLRTIAGGATRTESVACLLEHVATERVLVHDAARPCIMTRWIEDLISELGDALAGVPAVPVRDTLKRGAAGCVTETISRDGVYAVQTPQIFDTETLKRAHANAMYVGETPALATDDAGLVERLNVPIRLLSGDPMNVKITYPQDVELGEAVLRQRSRIRDGGAV